jgi:hypothetical protein
MDIKEYIKKYNLTFDKIKTDFAYEFDELFHDKKEWYSNLEDKVHLLKNDRLEQSILDVIKKLKSKTPFDENDTSILSVFVSNINTIAKIADRINNFKEGKLLTDGSSLRLADFFNTVALSNSLNAYHVKLNNNLNKLVPHIYSVIKHCQNPSVFPIYYKYWKNILREVLSRKDDYDSMCSFYASFPKENRHLNFATYLEIIGIQIAKNISQSGLQITKESKEYKYLTTKVINLERYKIILDDSIGITQEYLLEQGEQEEQQIYIEGKPFEVIRTIYERDMKARLKCLELKGYSCVICNIDFGKYYGVVAQDFIHVHHLTKISSFKESYKVNPKTDLVPVCPNCHSVIHKRKVPYTIEEMKKMIRK